MWKKWLNTFLAKFSRREEQTLCGTRFPSSISLLKESICRSMGEIQRLHPIMAWKIGSGFRTFQNRFTKSTHQHLDVAAGGALTRICVNRVNTLSNKIVSNQGLGTKRLTPTAPTNRPWGIHQARRPNPLSSKVDALSRKIEVLSSTSFTVPPIHDRWTFMNQERNYHCSNPDSISHVEDRR